jgi:hypothetical protein
MKDSKDFKGFKEIRLNVDSELWDFLSKTQGDKSVAFRITQILKKEANDFNQKKENKEDKRDDTKQEVNNDKRTQTRNTISLS